MRIAPTLLAPLALLSAQHATAQSAPQMSEAEVTALARYAMPHAFRAMQARCNGTLNSSSYIYSNGPALQSRLQAAAVGQFPAARSALMRFLGTEAAEMAPLINRMPPESLEPFVGEMIAGKVMTDMKLESCAPVNRALELLDPLPPENLASLIGFFMVEVQSSQGQATVDLRR